MYGRKPPHHRLHKDPHEGRKNPEIAQAVGIGPKGREDSRDVGALERIRYLYSENPKLRFHSSMKLRSAFTVG